MVLFMENIDFSNYNLYVFIALALILFFMQRLFTWLLPELFPKEEHRKLVMRYKSLLELGVWIIFVIWSVQYLHNTNQPYAIALFLLLILLVVVTGWTGLRDYIAGAVLKAGHKLTIHETVKVKDFTGKIIRFGSTNLVLESDAGETVYLPYSFLLGKVIVKAHPAESILRHTFRIEITRRESISDSLTSIRIFVLNLPWTSLTKEPQIKPLGETSSGQLIEITLYAFEKDHFQDMEQMIKSKFAIVADSGIVKTSN